MFHSQIITGGGESNQQAALDQLTQKYLGLPWPQPHPDLIILEPVKDALTIAQVRGLKTKLALKPYSAPLKLAVILAAEKLTLPAQNALLKTLEEPPDHSLIILVTDYPGLLLPTILSRCTTTGLGPAKLVVPNQREIETHRQSLQQLMVSKTGERLRIAARLISSRQPVRQVIQIHLYLFRQNLRQNPARATVANLHSCQTALRQLDANVNAQLVLGNLFLRYSDSKVG